MLMPTRLCSCTPHTCKLTGSKAIPYKQACRSGFMQRAAATTPWINIGMGASLLLQQKHRFDASSHQLNSTQQGYCRTSTVAATVEARPAPAAGLSLPAAIVSHSAHLLASVAHMQDAASDATQTAAHNLHSSRPPRATQHTLKCINHPTLLPSGLQHRKGAAGV